MVQTITRITDPHVFLAGRPPLGEYLGFIKAMALEGEETDDRRLAADWRAANDHIRDLEQAEAGLADGAEVGPLPADLHPLLDRLHADPIFQNAFKVVPNTVGVVELDRLVVFQKHINLAFVRELEDRLGESPIPETIFRICLPFDHPTPPVQAMPLGNNQFAFVSTSTDLRALDLRILSPDQATMHNATGPVTGVVGLMVGFGSNFLNVVRAEGRLVLNNGSHRAYALRELGVTHAPCIIQDVSRREELEVVIPPIAQQADTYLSASRPPLLKDYFDERLRKVLQVQRKLRQVRVVVQVEQLEMPAM